MAITRQTFMWRPIAEFDRSPMSLSEQAQLVVLFASGNIAASLESPLQKIRDAFPAACIVGCSTAGEILDVQVNDSSIAGIAMRFEHTDIRTAFVDNHQDNLAVAVDQLVTQLHGNDLRYVMLFSEGLHIDGSALARSMQQRLGNDVIVTGGLAGDGERFSRTAVIHNDTVSSHGIVAVGFFGERLRIGHGSLGGWDPFGPTRTITRSHGNVVYELDDMSALQLYKRYLGTYAESLPATGLLFPLSIRADNENDELVRTLLAIDDDTQSMTFAGTMPQGSKVRFMKANFDRLIDGAAGAAGSAKQSLDTDPEIALLVSCVGRRMVLGDLAEEELEAVRETLDDDTTLIGFYAYGELSPLSDRGCELHNQTMTITTLAEI